VEVQGVLFGSSWPDADCNYNPATREFSSTDSKGEQQRVADCCVVDVLNRECKKQHRFDVVSQTQGTLVALAAAGGAEKQRWLAAMETKQAREKRKAEEQALMAKHGVNTIEEARRKEAEERRQGEERWKALSLVLAATIPGWDAGAVTCCNIGVSSNNRYSSCVYYRCSWRQQ
jgi:hypothetical protein